MTVLASSEKSAKVHPMKFLLSRLFPYMFQRVRLEDGTVVQKYDYNSSETLTFAAPGYYVLLEVCRYQDMQTLYSPDYTPRTCLVRVSSLLYKGLYKGASLKVFCQFHRARSGMAKIWIAR